MRSGRVCVVARSPHVQAARVQIPSPGQASTPRSIWQTLWEGAFTCCMSPSSEDDPRDKDPPHPMPVAYSPR